MAIRRDDQEALSEKGATLQREEEISLNSKAKNNCSSTTGDRMVRSQWSDTDQDRTDRHHEVKIKDYRRQDQKPVLWKKMAEL